MYGYIPIIQIAAGVLSFVELGLGAYLVSQFSGPYASWTPSCLSFLVFNAIWSLLVLAYLGIVPRIVPRIFHGLVALALEWITMLFWFAGSIALAAATGPGWCSGWSGCHAWRAAIVFGFINWLLFLALAIIDTMEVMRGRRTTSAAPKPYVAA